MTDFQSLKPVNIVNLEASPLVCLKILQSSSTRALIEEQRGVGVGVSDRNAVRLVSTAQCEVPIFFRFDKLNGFVLGQFVHNIYITRDRQNKYL